MKSTPIPLESAVNRETILKIIAGEQRKWSGVGTAAHTSKLQGVRQRNTEVDGLVSRSGEKFEIQVYLFTLMGSVITTMPATQLCTEQAGAPVHVTLAKSPRLPSKSKSAGYDATHQVQAGTSTEVLHNFETCQNR